MAKSGRKQGLCETLTLLQEKNNARRGEIIPFFYASGKSWIVWFDCVPAEKVDATMTRIASEGFRLIEHASMLPKLNPGGPPSKTAAKKPRRREQDLELKNGTGFQLEITGDVELDGHDRCIADTLLSYHEKLPRNFRRFQVRPKFRPTEPERGIVGILKAYARDPSQSEGLKCVRAYDFDIESNLVDAYFHVEDKTKQSEIVHKSLEVEMEAQTVTQNVAQEIKRSHVALEAGKNDSEPPENRRRDPAAALESFLRLTKPLRNATCS